jgi:hypothetical protein
VAAAVKYLLLLSLLGFQATKKPFELVDGDRVVFVGNTFFERDLRYNHLETALAARWPSRNVTFRNLGWDGDTVWGDAARNSDRQPTASTASPSISPTSSPR